MSLSPLPTVAATPDSSQLAGWQETTLTSNNTFSTLLGAKLKSMMGTRMSP